MIPMHMRNPARDIESASIPVELIVEDPEAYDVGWARDMPHGDGVDGSAHHICH